jgi:hypothetical protein
VVADVGGNTAANGAWIITVNDDPKTSKTFTLNGAKGNGTYTGGGTVYLEPNLTFYANRPGDPAFSGTPDRSRLWTPGMFVQYGSVVCATDPALYKYYLVATTPAAETTKEPLAPITRSVALYVPGVPGSPY